MRHWSWEKKERMKRIATRLWLIHKEQNKNEGEEEGSIEAHSNEHLLCSQQAELVRGCPPACTAAPRLCTTPEPRRQAPAPVAFAASAAAARAPRPRFRTRQECTCTARAQQREAQEPHEPHWPYPAFCPCTGVPLHAARALACTCCSTSMHIPAAAMPYAATLYFSVSTTTVPGHPPKLSKRHRGQAGSPMRALPLLVHVVQWQGLIPGRQDVHAGGCQQRRGRAVAPPAAQHRGVAAGQGPV